MDQQRVGTLIVGAGHAGVQIAACLRELGYRGPVTLAGDEPQLPYHRPPLSKDVLFGRCGASPELRSERYYADAGIELHRGDPVVGLELPSGFPSDAATATTASGRVIRFDRLALAVGGRPRRLSVPGADLHGICYLRSLDDAIALGTRIRAARDVVVVGGGFIGLETAVAATGRTVTVLEAGSRLLQRSVAPAVSEHLRRAHTSRGITIRLGASVVGFVGANGRVRGVALASGEHVRADLVVIGVGLAPSIGLARSIGLDADAAGIAVDERARTSRAGVVAAGDCTVVERTSGRVRLESVSNAIAQARQAAASLLGLPAPAASVPWFWSDQADIKLQIAGLSAGYDEIVLRGTPAGPSFSALYYRDGRLIAIDAVNTPRDFLAVRRALLDGRTIPADRAGDIDVPLQLATLAAV